jgi:hypothetical protein
MTFISQTSFPGSPANSVITGVPCDSSVYVGAAVRMDSFGVAQNALADTADNANVLGVVVSKASPTVCTIRFLGVTEGDIFVGLDVTKEYFLSDVTAGLITTTPPTTPGHVLLRVGQTYSATRLLVIKGLRIIRS